ncbi:MAG: thioredoxin family protein [Chitinophagales bacterium]
MKKILFLLIVFSTLSKVYAQDLFTSLTYDEAKKYAKEFNRPFYVDITADWCFPCKMMEKTVFVDQKVVEYTHDKYLAIQLDVEDFDALILKSEYKISALPVILFFNSKGKLVAKEEGLQTGTKFLELLKKYD